MVSPALTRDRPGLSVRGTLAPLPSVEALAPRWLALSERAATSFFSGWTWISSWLTLTDETRLLFSVADGAGEDLALAILSRDPSDGSFWLNSPASKTPRMIFCEYADILANPELSTLTMSLLIGAIGKETLHVSGSLHSFEGLEVASHRRAIQRQKRVAPYVDLAEVRSADKGLDSLLSRNTRQQLTRAERLETTEADLRIEVATNTGDALIALEDMIALQRESFNARGQKSSFENPFFHDFTTNLIKNTSGDGRVEMLTCHAGDALIGVLFNLVHGNTVANYQSGFVLRDDPKAKPGYLVHRAAIDYYARHDYARYSFLAGEAQYKQSLATKTDVLYWADLARPSFYNWAENTARKMTGRLAT